MRTTPVRGEDYPALLLLAYLQRLHATGPIPALPAAAIGRPRPAQGARG